MLEDEQTLSNYSPQPDSTGLSDPNYISVSYLAIFKKVTVHTEWNLWSWVKIIIVLLKSSWLFCVCWSRFEELPPSIYKKYFTQVLVNFHLNWLRWYLMMRRRSRKTQDNAHGTCKCSMLSPTCTILTCITVANVIFCAWKKEIECGNMPITIMVIVGVNFISMSREITYGLSLSLHLHNKLHF